MTERSKRIPSLVLPVAGLGLTTFFTMAMATAGAAALWIILFGLLIGALASQISQLEVKSYLDAQSEESDGFRGRFRLVFVMGVLFGIAGMTVIVVSDAVGGLALLLFVLALLMGGRVSRSVRRALTSGMSTEAESAEEGEDPQSQTALMSRLTAIGDTTGKQMVNLAWLVLGFAVGAGLALVSAMLVDAQLGG
ncbi:MAG: hypothetical protein OXJ54_16960 [Gemmatimonadetes bacterium]|nr:hypothetical protein [Candidatus Palauibacter rhopaloidicola]